MNTQHDSRVLQARVRLMLDHPWLASAIAAYPLRRRSGSPLCRTMATDGTTIFYNPEFSAGLQETDLMFILAHETAHCLLGHIDRRGSRDGYIWNLAVDYATNLLLVEMSMEAPSYVLLDHRFRGMTAEAIYDTLLKEAHPRDENSVRAGSSSDSIKQHVSGDRFSSTNGSHGDTAYSVRGDSDDSSTEDEAEDGNGIFRDVHLDPDDPLTTVMRGEPAPDQEQRQHLRRSLQTEASSCLRGQLPGVFTEEINAANRAKTDWRTLLAEFIAGLRRSDYRLFPFRKKMLWQGLYLPSVGVPAPDHLVVAIDTSGSMDEEDISQILAEIDRLRDVSESRLTILQCDASIQNVEELQPHETARWHKDSSYGINGRGGTDFRPVFDWISSELVPREGPPDACIYMTDGHGSFPNQAPDYPVIWLLQPEGFSSIPFGRVICMEQ